MFLQNFGRDIYKVYFQGLYENGEYQMLLGPSAPTCKRIEFGALREKMLGGCTLLPEWQTFTGGGTPYNGLYGEALPE